jgi:hypothetical protein
LISQGFKISRLLLQSDNCQGFAMNVVDQNQSLDLDTRLLSEFVYALNIARRQVLAYPQGHPIVSAATSKLIAVVSPLLEFRKDITLGIARDTLIVDGKALDAANPVFRDLAQNLFNKRIASLTISRDLTEDEVYEFFGFFCQTAEQLAEAGGFEQILARSDFRNIRAQGVDFSAFSTTDVDVVHAPKTKALENDTALLWKSFANGIVKGSIDPNGEKFVPEEDIDPVLLAEVMNQGQDAGTGSLGMSYDEAITAFLREADQQKNRGQAYEETVDRLGKMAGNLNPELRRQFLNSMLRSCSERPDTAEAVLSKVPQSALLDAFEHMDASAIEIPQTLMDVLGKLASSSGDEVSQSRVAGEVNRSVHETAEQLTSLFSEDRSEYFVPRDYQDALAVMASAQVDHDLDKDQVDELVSSLAGHKIEAQFSAVLLDLLERGVDQPTSDAVGHNLAELIDYFLEAGNFESLTTVYVQLHRYVTAHSKVTFDETLETLQRFASDEFVATVLDGLEVWGKSVQDSIQTLIGHVGAPFVDPLLDRLAEEPSMSRRRLLMQCLVKIGPDVLVPVAARFNDDRWYFVRNMVIVLRQIKDPSIVMLMGRLSGYDHPKVQFEVMNTYLHYGDDRANRFLHKELTGKNPASLLNAVRLAAKSSDPRVVSLLSKVLNKRFPVDRELEVKTSVVKVLQEKATDEVLPEMESFLLGKKMFGGSAEPLKIKAVAVLGKIGSVDAGILAGKVAQSTSGALAKAAEEVLVQIHRKLT